MKSLKALIRNVRSLLDDVIRLLYDFVDVLTCSKVILNMNIVIGNATHRCEKISLPLMCII